MKRIRDYNLNKFLEKAMNKKTEFIQEYELRALNSIILINEEKTGYMTFKDMNDFDFIKYLPDNLYVEFVGYDLSNMELTFKNTLSKVVIKNCIIDNFVINVEKETEGFEVILDKVRSDSEIKVNEQFYKCKSLKVIGKPTTELTRDYTVQEITNKMKELIPGYLNLPDDKQAALLQKQGYLSIYPQRIDITGIDKLVNLKAISLKYMEIDEIRFSEITKYSKDIRVLDVIEFIDCTFNEAPVLYKQPVKRLVINHCNVKRKELLPNFVQVIAIEVIDTKGMELPKLTEPKIIKGLKLVSSEVNITNITDLKKIETVIILEQKLPNVNFAKKLKKLKQLVVTKDFVENKDVLKKLKKIEFIEVEEDDKEALYNELFI